MLGLANFIKQHPLLNLVVCEDPKFIYFKIARTAGTSILRGVMEGQLKAVLHEKSDPVNYAKWIAGLEDDMLDSYWKFTIVRHPLDRMLSLYYYLGFDKQGISFRDFIQKRMFKFGNRCAIHCMPQQNNTHLEYGTYGKQTLVDYLGRFENLPEAWQVISSKLGVSSTLPHLSRTEHGPYREYYDDEMLYTVRLYYGTEMFLLDYEF